MSLVRPATFAGRFYPADSESCAAMIDAWSRAVSAHGPPSEAEDSVAAPRGRGGQGERIAAGAIAPHAGWIYSGETAYRSLSSVATWQPDTIVVFGAVHVRDRNVASLYPCGGWETPFGIVPIDEELAQHISRNRLISSDAGVHTYEHSIEVELPILRRLMPEARLLAIMVNPGPRAAEVGRLVADAALSLGRRVAFVASTDLTHYGPAFDFEPAGRGEPGIAWAKNVNDRRFLARVAELDAEGVVPEAVEHRNACGAGAVAATLAAVERAGARAYCELAHTCSAERERAGGGRPLNSVGYAAGVFYSES